MRAYVAAAFAICVLLVLGPDITVVGQQRVTAVIDLTHELNTNAVFWPGNLPLNFTVVYRDRVPARFWYETNQFETAEHGGTHLDAPAHFGEGKWRVHEIPPERLVGPGVVVDVTGSVGVNADYRLGVSDLVEWERQHGSIPDGAIVFMMSGWAVRYPNKTLTFNTNNVTDPATFHFPGFHPDAIDWLVKHRNISMVGVDTPSTDYGQSKVFEVHQKMAEASLIGLENVNNLEKIPASGATIVAGVIKLHDGSGGPVRILALVGRQGDPACGSSAGNLFHTYTGSTLVFMLIIMFTQLWLQTHAGRN